MTAAESISPYMGEKFPLAKDIAYGEHLVDYEYYSRKQRTTQQPKPARPAAATCLSGIYWR